jgi:parallel beta-helix repeat protein
LVGNKEFGIYAVSVSSITIFKNNIENSNTGINLRSCSNSMIINNNLISNPYHGILIDGLSKNITVSHNEIKGILTGLVGGSSAITIIQASNITIKYNVVKESYYGIQFFISSYNTASGNDVKNTRHGIYLRQSSDISINYNLIQNNNNGIYLIKSTNNTINNNIIRQNEDGIRVQNSSHNIIYNNNFINNNRQVTDDSKNLPNISPSINNWDNGYPTGGNYWSNYSGKDEKKGPNQDIQGSDGIGDVPYVIYKDNKDNYPLMEPLMINITTPPIPNITIPTITITTSPIETSPTTTHIATQPSQFDFSLLIILLIIIIAVATVIAIVRVIKK